MSRFAPSTGDPSILLDLIAEDDAEKNKKTRVGMGCICENEHGSPENGPLEEEIRFENHHFQVPR